MQAPPVVALGQKDKVQPSLGQRIRSHFYNNRGLYGAAAGAAVSSGLAWEGGHHFGVGHGRSLERSAQLSRQIRMGLLHRGIAERVL